MVYEYHFWLHQYYDPGTMDFSKLIYDDIRGRAVHILCTVFLLLPEA